MNDINLIDAFRSMLDFAINKEKDIFNVPDAHQQMVMKRFNKVRKNPERLVDWDEVRNTLKQGIKNAG